MANTPVQFYRGSANTTSSLLYTVPSNKTAIVTNISITNTGTTETAATILFDGVQYLDEIAVAANDTMILDMRTVLAQGLQITGFTSTAGVKFHISGVITP
jgi:hypothetical protein